MIIQSKNTILIYICTMLINTFDKFAGDINKLLFMDFEDKHCRWLS
jgi:hypothetical protein